MEPASEIPNCSYEQGEIIKRIIRGENIFFTGPAGTGKSHILHRLAEEFEKQCPTKKIQFTAMTGAAAILINGTTLHSATGIGLGEEDANEIGDKILKKNKNAKKMWQRTDVLVIDEISMMNGELFDKLDIIGKRVRRNYYQPWGGMQVVVCGDFFQLPPVNKRMEIEEKEEKGEEPETEAEEGKRNESSNIFAFDSRSWNELFANPNQIIILEHSFRQERDLIFSQILNEVRVGNISSESLEILNQKSSSSTSEEEEKTSTSSTIIPTQLFATNIDVDHENETKLAELETEEMRFIAEDYAVNERLGAKYFKHLSVQEEIVLKVGAQVVLLFNINPKQGLVNGTRGVIESFVQIKDKDSTIIVPRIKVILPTPSGELKEYLINILPRRWEYKDIKTKEVFASRKQIPLRLAWALTIHKSQGMTLDFVNISCRGIFEYGQLYVALSRVRSLYGLHLSNFLPRYIKTHPKVLAYYENVQQRRRLAGLI